MIQERAEVLIRKIQEHTDRVRYAGQIDGFRTQADVIAKAQERLAELFRSWRLLTELGLEIPIPDNAELLRALAQLRDSTKDNPAFILGSSRLIAVKVSLPAFCSRLEESLQNAWRAYAEAQVPPINADVLAVLDHITALRPHVRRVSELLRQIGERTTRIPTVDADIETFQALVRALAAAWGQLDSDRLPPEVLAFLRAAGSSAGAPLSSLSTAVLEWLSRHDLDKSFAIRQRTV